MREIIPFDEARRIVRGWRETHNRLGMRLIPRWVYERLELEIALRLSEQNCEIALQAGNPAIHRCNCAGTQAVSR